MGYVVINGELKRNGRTFVSGDAVPALKGQLAAEEAVGAVEWQDSRTHPQPAEKAPATKKPAKKKAVRRDADGT